MIPITNSRILTNKNSNKFCTKGPERATKTCLNPPCLMARCCISPPPHDSVPNSTMNKREAQSLGRSEPAFSLHVTSYALLPFCE